MEPLGTMGCPARELGILVRDLGHSSGTIGSRGLRVLSETNDRGLSCMVSVLPQFLPSSLPIHSFISSLELQNLVLFFQSFAV